MCQAQRNINQSGYSIHSNKVHIGDYPYYHLNDNQCQLYFRAERTAAPDGKVKRVNKLISVYNEDDNNAPELTRSVQEQCQLADGFILIVNASHFNEQG